MRNRVFYSIAISYFLAAFVFADSSHVAPVAAHPEPDIAHPSVAQPDTAAVVPAAADTASAEAEEIVADAAVDSLSSDTGLRHSVKSIEGLTVTPHSRSIQIASAENAIIYLFDSHVDIVFTKKISAGLNIISLENQKHGIYYAVVQVGEQMQVVKVVVI